MKSSKNINAFIAVGKYYSLNLYISDIMDSKKTLFSCRIVELSLSDFMIRIEELLPSISDALVSFCPDQVAKKFDYVIRVAEYDNSALLFEQMCKFVRACMD